MNKGNILIVDDDQLLLEMTSDLLTKAGYQVATASNTIGAGYQLKDFDPHLVVLDINLPGSLSGDQACDTFRKYKPGIKIIFYSGVEEEKLQQLADRHQAEGYIPKGSRPNELIAAIDRLLGHETQ